MSHFSNGRDNISSKIFIVHILMSLIEYDKFIEMFGEQASRCSSGWGLTPKVEGVLSQIRMLNTTDPSGETFQKIVKALDENTARLKEQGW